MLAESYYVFVLASALPLGIIYFRNKLSHRRMKIKKVKKGEIRRRKKSTRRKR